MHVAVAIVGYNNLADIMRCLTALQDTTFPDFEVIICENGGADAYAKLLEALPTRLSAGQAVRCVRSDVNVGFAGGVNRCLRESPQAQAWWVLNPDTAPDPQALGAMVKRLEAGDCDAVGCTLYLPDGRVQSHGGLWQSWLARSVSIGLGTSRFAPADGAAVEATQTYLNGAAMLISQRFWRTVGPMREDYFLYAEEVEWFIRARALGLRLGFAADAQVLHEQGTTTGAGGQTGQRSRLSVYLTHRNEMLLTRDCFPMRFPIVAAAALAVIVASYGKRRAWRQLGYGVHGWIAGVVGQRGRPQWA